MYYHARGSFINRLTEEGWFPKNGVIFCTEKLSMDMSVLPLFMKHLDKFVCRNFDKEEHFVLTLDVHGSRKGFEWVEMCMENTVEVVLAPANTSPLFATLLPEY